MDHNSSCYNINRINKYAQISVGEIMAFDEIQHPIMIKNSWKLETSFLPLVMGIFKTVVANTVLSYDTWPIFPLYSGMRSKTMKPVIPHLCII